MNVIVAVDAEWGIGYKGDLLVRIKEDLMHFASLTTGKTVILGSNTLATFPGGRVLKDRRNIVLHPDASYAPEGALVVHSIDELMDTLDNLKKDGLSSDDIFVIGGASVYRQLLPYCSKAYVTKLCDSFEKDAWFPNLDASDKWSLTYKGEPICAVARLSGGEKKTAAFSFDEYTRIAED